MKVASLRLSDMIWNSGIDIVCERTACTGMGEQFYRIASRWQFAPWSPGSGVEDFRTVFCLAVGNLLEVNACTADGISNEHRRPGSRKSVYLRQASSRRHPWDGLPLSTRYCLMDMSDTAPVYDLESCRRKNEGRQIWVAGLTGIFLSISSRDEPGLDNWG